MYQRKVCVAPMMECTDRHFRYFIRLITHHTWLFTEMITTEALLHGKATRLLQFSEAEKPIGLQIGGSDPEKMACCARLGEDFGYDEININVGCPSNRVQSAQFGACLMAKPQLVAECVAAMRSSIDIPVSVKTRIGIDKHDSFDYLARFINVVSSAGCEVFIIHARKAILHGLSPKENREIPSLRYDIVHRLKQEFPWLQIIVNGGITSLSEVQQQLDSVDGVMIGRQAYNDPYFLANVDRQFFGDERHIPSQFELLESYLRYVDEQLPRGVRLNHITRHLMGLFLGLPGARAWRQHLGLHSRGDAAGSEVIRNAAQQVATRCPAVLAS